MALLLADWRAPSGRLFRGPERGARVAVGVPAVAGDDGRVGREHAAGRDLVRSDGGDRLGHAARCNLADDGVGTPPVGSDSLRPHQTHAGGPAPGRLAQRLELADHSRPIQVPWPARLVAGRKPRACLDTGGVPAGAGRAADGAPDSRRSPGRDARGGCDCGGRGPRLPRRRRRTAWLAHLVDSVRARRLQPNVGASAALRARRRRRRLPSHPGGGAGDGCAEADQAVHTARTGVNHQTGGG
mmetsp:Transcript_29361/g.94713  ORF Transcript_29361/g.94713 Transcript_29361/m.94713 type:complete len:242 (+) Transcript_29361:373-1098(+)